MHTHSCLKTGGVALLFALPILSLFAQTAHADKNAPLEIAYEGELRDGSNKPISGIYPLEFRLYRSKDDKRPAWRELHWVAIENGSYSIRLGNVTPIRKNVARSGQKVHLGINLKDVGELTREMIVLPEPKTAKTEDPKPEPEDKEPPANEESDAKPEPQETKTAKKATKYTTESSFATVAEYAQRAGVAEDAEKLGGKTIEELEAEIERLRDLLAEHRTDKTMHKGGGGARVGVSIQTTPKVGGTGGAPYERSCPKGYVVTGIRGGAGALLDSIQLICSPLE